MKLFRILLVFSAVYIMAGAFSVGDSQKLVPWKISPDKWDNILFHNNERYVVEGKGAMKVFLGYPENEIYRIWGPPTYRENHIVEKLHYTSQYVKGFFMLKKGFIRLIRVYIPKHSSENFHPFTALGFEISNITATNQEEIIRQILQLYPRAPHIILPKAVAIYSRGITYGFYNNALSYIEVYQPQYFDFRL